VQVGIYYIIVPPNYPKTEVAQKKNFSAPERVLLNVGPEGIGHDSQLVISDLKESPIDDMSPHRFFQINGYLL
jgi:hypothetical protein